MTPLGHFEAVWTRCNHLTSLHAYLAANVTGILDPKELLRAEWVARVAALDLYIHELVAQRMRSIFEGFHPPTPSYLRFSITNDVSDRIRLAGSANDAATAFDLYIRERLSLITYQDPDIIADGVRLFSTIELWNEVAVNLGATPSTKNDEAKRLKKELSLLINRRNKIAHEGDLQPTPLREPWPISKPDLAFVTATIDKVVRTIDAIV